MNSEGLNMVDQQHQIRLFFYLGREHPIFDEVKQFIQSENLDDKQKQEAMELASSLKQIDFQDYFSVTLETVQRLNKHPISPTGKKLLEEKFGIQAKAVNRDSGKLHSWLS